MAKRYPPRIQRALRGLGRDIRIARKKRRMPVADFAVRVGVSVPTIVRLERGEPGVSLGCLAMALMVLGELRRLEELLDVSTDDAGLMLDAAALPQRIRSRRVRPIAADGKSGEEDRNADVEYSVW